MSTRLPRHCRLVAIVAPVALAACSGQRLLDEPAQYLVEAPLASASDARIDAHLDWVVIPGGPGTWVQAAAWDEYRLRIGNRTGVPLRLTAVCVVDAAGGRSEQSANIHVLTRRSLEVAKAWREEGVEVDAHAAGDGLVVAGGVMAAAGGAYAYTVLAGSATASAAAAGAAVGAMVLAPVFIVSGLVENQARDAIARELIVRSTAMPAAVPPGGLREVTAFVPIVPSPTGIEITYENAGRTYVVTIDTTAALAGLHLRSQEE